jgi:hypothetical protein
LSADGWKIADAKLTAGWLRFEAQLASAGSMLPDIA